MILVWFFLTYLFGGKYDPWVFLDFIFYFIGAYFLVVLIFTLKYKALREKIIISYLSSIVPILVFSFLLLMEIDKFALTTTTFFLIGPIIISYFSQFLNSLFRK